MRSAILSVLITAALSLLGRAHAKYVFAHYMVGTTTEDHIHQDIDDAMAMGLDGFALNIGVPTADFVADAMSSMFGYAAYRGFKLFVSMDLYAYGDACYKAGLTTCNGPFDYYDVMAGYIGNSAWFRDTPNGKPMISTFSSGGFQWAEFNSWRESWGDQIYFIPNFDETEGYYDSPDAWWYYWGNVTDGLFSWEASWPESVTRPGYGGTYPGDISQDSVVIKAAKAHDHTYMMGLSTLQYKDSYGANVYRGGELNLPTRMANILVMEPQPDYIQIITWNDFPESHNIGNVWPEQNTDIQPNNYGNAYDWPHQAWQGLHTSFIKAWKAGGDKSSMAPVNPNNQVEGVMWYKTILQDAECQKDNQGDKYYTKPDNFDTGLDVINYAIVVAAGVSGLTLRCYSQGVQVDVDRTLTPGMNYGWCEDMAPGSQKLVVMSGGTVKYSAVSVACVDAGCPQDIYNMNYQVVTVNPGDATAHCYDYAVGRFTASGTFVDRAPAWQTVNCLDPGVTNAAVAQDVRWADLDTDAAWAAAVVNWTADTAPGGLTFSEQVSNFFHGPENINCGDITTSSCPTSNQCNSVQQPPGYFILNSLGLIRQMNADFYYALGTAEEDMTTLMGSFASTFSPVNDKSRVEEIILDIIGIGFVVGAGPVWTNALKSVPFFNVETHPERLDLLKEEVNTLLSWGIPVANEQGSSDTDLNAQNNLTAAMGKLIQAYRVTINNINVSLFNGSRASIDMLGQLMADGRLMEPNTTSSQLTAMASIEHALFAYLIPRAWAVGDDATNAFILDSGNACSDLDSGGDSMSDSTAKATGVCVNNKAYYLLSAHGSPDCSQPSCGGGSCKNKFTAPPGLSSLVKGNGWGNVQLEDLVRGALNGYAAHGNQNGWPLIDLTTATSLSDIYDKGIQVAGLVQIVICDGTTAWTNWFNESDDEENFPCQPLTNSKRARAVWRQLKRKSISLWTRFLNKLTRRC